jgi:PAS domain S-box-containing protein
MYMAGAPRTADLLAALQTVGMDAQAAINARQLLFPTSRETYLQIGRFDPAAMIEFLRVTSERARQAGYAGLRAIGDMTWAVGLETSTKRLVEYEARLNELTSATGMRIICLYDRGRFRPELIREVLRTHPVAIVGDKVHDNPYFEPADLVIGGSEVEARRVDWMLEQMRKRTDRATAAAELGSWALHNVAPAELMEAAAHIVARTVHARFVEVIELGTLDGPAHPVASVGFQRAPVGADLAIQDVWFETSSQAVLVPDWSQERRIAPRPELRALGITSSIGIPISRGVGELPYGVAWVHSAEPRIFTDDEVVFLQTIAGGIAQAMARTRAEDFFETLIDNAPDLIARFDRDFRLTYVNLAIQRATGGSSSSLVGKTSREIGLPQALVEAWELVLHQAWHTRREQVTEFIIPTQLGERYFQTRVMPEFGPDGSVQSVLSISRDLTDQRKAETERAELYREVVAHQASLREIVSRMEQDRANDQQRSAQAIRAEHLTPRERDVLRLLVRGWTNREIAAELRLAPGTVKNHVANILATLDATDRTQAAVCAVVLGISLPD